MHELDGLNLDAWTSVSARPPARAELLRAAMDQAPVSEVLVSHLLKSNCLVTGQPDWGSVRIDLSLGPQIDQGGLLRNTS